MHGAPVEVSIVSSGFISKERKEAVVIGAVVADEALKDCFNHVDASDSGVGEFKKMSKSGTHCSIFTRSL